MASSYTVLGTEKMTTGENAGTWGTTTNTNLQILEQALGGYLAKSIAGSAQTTTLAITDGDSTASTSEARHHVIKLTGAITGNQVVTVPNDVVKSYIVSNATSGDFTVTFQTVSGSGFAFAGTNKGVQLLFADGTNIVDTGISSVGSNDLDGDELILDEDADTSITADTDDQIDIKVAGADQIKITDGVLAPSSDNDIDLGTSSLEFKDAFFDGTVTSDAFAGPLTGDVTGDVTGNVSGTAATVTTAAQSNITSLGTLTTLTVDNIIVNGTTIGHTSDTDLLTLTSAVLTVAGELDAATLDISGNADIDGTTNLDTVDIDGAVQLDATLTVGADDQGYDIKFFGDTASAYMLWDTSADDLVLAGVAGIDLAGDIDVDGTTNLDIVDIDGAVQIDATFTSGVDGQGYDTKFFGDTSSAYMLWDTSADDLILSGGAGLIVPDGQFTLGSTAVSSTAAEINLIDGGTARGTTAIVDGDGILHNDGGTMRMTSVETFATYFASEITGGSAIVTVGALDSGSITSGFGAIDNGTSNIRSATITAETAFVPDASGGADLGTTALEFNDAFFNDSAVINFGDDQDTTLTHTDGTGLTLNSTNKLCFNDTSQFVHGSSTTVLSIGATDEIDLTATAIDINGTCDISGTFSLAGTNITASAAELNYTDGVTSAIQTQLNAGTTIGKAIAMAIVFG